MPSEAKKYWQYSRECTKQALEVETPTERDQLLDLARFWTEAAVREGQLNAVASGRVAENYGGGGRAEPLPKVGQIWLTVGDQDHDDVGHPATVILS